MVAATEPPFSKPNPSPTPGNRHVSERLPDEIGTNIVTANLAALGEIPTQFAVVVDEEVSKARWGHFTNSITLDLGPGDGTHKVNFGYMWSTSKTEWHTFNVRVISRPPPVVITDPKSNFSSQPTIQLQGYSTEPVDELRYDLIDGTGNVVRRNEQGFVNDQHYDTNLFRLTTNFFTCYDIDLSPGTNTIVLRCTDLAGNVFTTNLTFVFTTTGDENPPTLTVAYPPNGHRIMGSTFTLHGLTDDPTARILALVSDSNGKTQEMEGSVGREGEYGIEQIPLSEGYTFVTVIASDAAGNTSLTNITVRNSHDLLVMDRVPDSKLWQRTVTVTGSYNRSNHTVWVNGVKAAWESPGRWRAENVPISESSTAYFHMTAIPDNGLDSEEETAANSSTVVIWGEATNTLKAGISFPLADTNMFNSYQCQLYVDSSAVIDAAPRWVRPKEQYRYSLRLHKSDGTEVPWLRTGEKREGPLPQDLNIHHLTKNAVRFIDGIIPGLTNAPVCLDSLSLVQQFALHTPGTYHFEVVEHLFRIESNGRLAPFSLPPVSTEVTIIDQPAALYFFLNDLHRKGRLWWNTPWESLQVGLMYEHNSRPKIADRFSVYLLNQRTNQVRNLILPKPEEQFELELLDSAGNQVAKTALGKMQGQPLTLQGKSGLDVYRKRRQIRPLSLEGRDATHCRTFELYDYFDVRKAGTYRLIYRQRLYRKQENGEIEELSLPAVAVPLEILVTPSDP